MKSARNIVVITQFLLYVNGIDSISSLEDLLISS